MESLVDQIEEFYETETVIRACVICDDDETLCLLVQQLEEKHHTVDVITEEELSDERMSFAHKLHTFRDASSRMIAMSYSTWYAIQDRVEVDVLPYQNLFILANLESGLVHYIGSYVKNASERGFTMSDVQSHFLVLSCE